MARLEKSFEDYFKLPVLLKAVGNTPASSLARIHEGLTFEGASLPIDDRY